MFKTIKGGSFAVALGASFALAGAASAATIYNVTDVEMVNPLQVTLSVAGAGSEQVLLGQTEFTVGSTSGPGGSNTPQTLSAFCVDLYHQITLGGQSLQYQFEPWTTDFGGHTLSTITQEQIDYLTDKYINTTSFLEEAAQAAIWEKEVPGTTVVTGDTALDAEIALLAAGTGQTSSVRDVFTSLNNSQSFNMVPEPATWAMMILGSMGAGLGLRIARRNRLMAAATA